jgi:hypothetical protein
VEASNAFRESESGPRHSGTGKETPSGERLSSDVAAEQIACWEVIAFPFPVKQDHLSGPSGVSDLTFEVEVTDLLQCRAILRLRG